MTDLRTAAQQALWALEGWDNYGKWVWPKSALEQAKRNTTESLAALRDALAEPVQEPVAWMDIDSDGQRLAVRQWSDGNRDEVPLYTTPPRHKPLTDEQIDKITVQQWGRGFMVPAAGRAWAREIERALGIGGSNE